MIIYQVNKIISKRNIIGPAYRYVHNAVGLSRNLIPLESRKLLKISGEDVSTYLQGLITNDMGHFEDGTKCMYAMFLNNKGRVLYDTLIYKWGDDAFLIECDNKILATLHKHLKVFKLKRKLEFTDVNNDLKLWALVAPADVVSDPNIDTKNKMNVFKDPRLADLGFRVVISANINGADVAESIKKDIKVENNEEKYKYLRYSLGVSEGADDLPPGSSFPLEANCDYLHGVSFHKGCYIGQEVTARTHHTGVVRKRIMPLKFSQEINENLDQDLVISDASKPKSNFGKLKGFVKDCGLGLVRIKEALEAKDLVVGSYSVRAIKPAWWPVEAPKEKINQKLE